MTTLSTIKNRSTGLDTLRAAAILLVFMYHYMVFVSREPTFGWLSVVGWVGVDLFFVLSGYLIANQLFAGADKGQTLSLRAFYARRALRTWPAFWVVVAAYFLLPSVMGGKEPPPLWRFLTFTQNWQLEPGTAFSHAWSLCIEEQFYLVLPLAYLIATRVRLGRFAAWTFMGALIALGVGARFYFWNRYGLESSGLIGRYHPYVYYATLCRFDEFIPGVAVAYIRHFHPQTWQRITLRGQTILAIALFATITIVTLAHSFYYIDGYGYGFFLTVFGYSLIAMAFALLVVAALSPSSFLYRMHVPGAYHLALWSYSIYLTHKAIGHILFNAFKPLAISSSLLLLVISVVSVLVGALLYWIVESPFMKLRDRLFPSNFTLATASTRVVAAAD
jgi:peptidoglycan/LPS O-acetylase OafA/YrhL